MLRIFSPLRLAVLGVAVLLVVVLPLWCGRSPAPVVEVARARHRPLQVKVATNGKVEPPDEAEADVRARLDGRILDIPDPGTQVTAGDEILRIDAGPVSAELAAAESEKLAALEALRAAKHELSVLVERFTTDKALFEKKALTRERYAESEAAVRDAEERVASLDREVPLRVASLDLRIEELNAQLESTVVTAPFNGTVYKTEAKKGEMVTVGDPILWIADLERLRVRTNIDQVDLGRAKKGQRVVISSNAFPDRTWSGRISEVIPHVLVRENRSISEGLVQLEAPTDGLVPGMTVDVDIIVAEVPDALQVPAEAVFTNGREWFVYRIDGKRVRRTTVQVGLSSLVATEITRGLEVDDLVVIGPTQALRDGMRIKVRKTQASSLPRRRPGHGA
jgi:HlyD family secretion protein